MYIVPKAVHTGGSAGAAASVYAFAHSVLAVVVLAILFVTVTALVRARLTPAKEWR